MRYQDKLNSLGYQVQLLEQFGHTLIFILSVAKVVSKETKYDDRIQRAAYFLKKSLLELQGMDDELRKDFEAVTGEKFADPPATH